MREADSRAVPPPKPLQAGDHLPASAGLPRAHAPHRRAAGQSQLECNTGPVGGGLTPYPSPPTLPGSRKTLKVRGVGSPFSAMSRAAGPSSRCGRARPARGGRKDPEARDPRVPRGRGRSPRLPAAEALATAAAGSSCAQLAPGGGVGAPWARGGVGRARAGAALGAGPPGAGGGGGGEGRSAGPAHRRPGGRRLRLRTGLDVPFA
ncbi:unnamed protein product [Rangifer tarandus platyrhynchus]|uniref:Uncharacterized protein n=1 Tax=Rangifer tarandus platyrhynchus TaxID=3082113 RepID=A0ABN8ZDB5_RANTA|nr:unnamed protein product [Rangifer tarandus platyrhynchus]